MKSGVHLLFRVICGRILYHSDIVAKLSGKADSRLYAGMRYESDDDELMDAAFP